MSRLQLLSLSLLLISACAPVAHVQYKTCDSVIVRPGHFWEASQSYTVCYNEVGHMVFPAGSTQQDIVSGALGPVAGTVAGHIVVPLPTL